MKIEHDYITFSSGRRVYANEGIVGISDDLDVSEGYDGQIYVRDDDLEENPLTPAEQIELADYMLELWQRFKARAMDERMSQQ